MEGGSRPGNQIQLTGSQLEVSHSGLGMLRPEEEFWGMRPVRNYVYVGRGGACERLPVGAKKQKPSSGKKGHQLSSGGFCSHPNEGSQKALIVKIHNVSVLRQKELLQRPRTTVFRHIL